MSNNLAVYINENGRIKKPENLTLTQFSSNNFLTVYSPTYMDEVYITTSNSTVKHHMVYESNDGVYNIYKLQVGESITGTAVPSTQMTITFTVRGYVQDSRGFMQSFCTGSFPVVLFKSDAEREYDNSYNGVDVKNIWRKLGEITNKEASLVAKDTELDTKITNEVNKIVSGETVVGKATNDANGNNIYNTYEAKTDHNSDVGALQTQINNLNTSKVDVTAYNSKISELSGGLANNTEVLHKLVIRETPAGNYAYGAKLDNSGHEIDKTYVNDIDLEYNGTTGTLTVKGLRPDGTQVTISNVNLPQEEFIVSGRYDRSTKTIKLTLKSGQVISIPVGDIVDGLVNEDQLEDVVKVIPTDMMVVNDGKRIALYHDGQYLTGQTPIDVMTINNSTILDGGNIDVYNKTEVDQLAGIVVSTTRTSTIILNDNTIFDIGTLTGSLELQTPTNINQKWRSELDFSTTNNLPTLVYPENVLFIGDDVISNIFVPETYADYTIVFYYSNGKVRGVVARY